MQAPQLGVDIEEVRRFRRLIRDRRFVKRVFTAAEDTYCRARKNQLQHFAVRFAAKEAVWKAMSDFLRRSHRVLTHREIGIRNDEAGRPRVVFPRRFRRLEARVSVSLSHTREYVVAVAAFAAGR